MLGGITKRGSSNGQHRNSPQVAVGGGKDLFAGIADEALEINDIEFSFSEKSAEKSSPQEQVHSAIRHRDGYQYVVI